MTRVIPPPKGATEMARRRVEVQPDPWADLLDDHAAVDSLAASIRADQEARHAAFLASPESKYDVPSNPRD